MSICLIEFPISVLGEPYLYHQSVCFTRKWGIYDIVVIFDFEVLLGGVCFRLGGY